MSELFGSSFNCLIISAFNNKKAFTPSPGAKDYIVDIQLLTPSSGTSNPHLSTSIL